MPKQILEEDFRNKCRLIQTRTPLLVSHVVVFVDGWQIEGYLFETSETPMISVSSKGFAEAEKLYYSAYDRLVTAGFLKPKY